MIQMLPTVLLSLVSSVISFRLASENQIGESDLPVCPCSESDVVDDVDVGKRGCAEHFGQRFGYVCYVENGAGCAGTRLSTRTGVYWRSCRSDHLTEEAANYLREAMEEIDLEALRTTISVAEERNVDPELIAAARAREEVVIQMIAARDELMAAIEGFSAERLQAALETAEELELDEFLSEETLDRAVERFQFLDERAKADNALRAAVEGHLLTVLQDALHTAKLKHCHEDVIHMGERRVQELEVEIAAADAELAAAVVTRDSARLQAATENAQRLEAVQLSVIQAARDRLAHLSRMDSAVVELRLAIAAFDLHSLEVKLQTAKDLDAYPDVLGQGDDRVIELTRMNLDAEATLVAATADHNIINLQNALSEAERLTGGTILATNIRAAETRLAALLSRGEAVDDLETAIADIDLLVLRQKLAVAQDLGALEEVPQVLTRAEARIVELQEMMAEATRTLAEAVAAEHQGNHEQTDALVAALAEVDRLHCVREWAPITEETIAAAEARLARLRDLDEATDRLVATYDSDDMHKIITALDHARDVGVIQSAIDEAEAHATVVRVMLMNLRKRLIELTEGTDIDALQRALDETKRLRAASPRRIDAAEARLAELRAR